MPKGVIRADSRTRDINTMKTSTTKTAPKRDSNILTLMLTPQEDAFLKASAAKLGLTPSQYVERLVFETAREMGITTSADARPEGTRPIYFRADTVQLLEELCDAAGFGSVGDYADEFLSSEIWATLEGSPSDPGGVIEIIEGSYQLTEEDQWKLVVARWKAKRSAA